MAIRPLVMPASDIFRADAAPTGASRTPTFSPNAERASTSRASSPDTSSTRPRIARPRQSADDTAVDEAAFRRGDDHLHCLGSGRIHGVQVHIDRLPCGLHQAWGEATRQRDHLRRRHDQQQEIRFDQLFRRRQASSRLSGWLGACRHSGRRRRSGPRHRSGPDGLRWRRPCRPCAMIETTGFVVGLSCCDEVASSGDQVPDLVLPVPDRDR